MIITFYLTNVQKMCQIRMILGSKNGQNRPKNMNHKSQFHGSRFKNDGNFACLYVISALETRIMGHVSRMKGIYQVQTRKIPIILES